MVELETASLLRKTNKSLHRSMHNASNTSKVTEEGRVHTEMQNGTCMRVTKCWQEQRIVSNHASFSQYIITDSAVVVN